MKPPRFLGRVLALAAAATALRAADRITVTVTHDLALAHPAETIAVPWADLNQAMPHAMIQHLAVKDATGASLPFQVTNIAACARANSPVKVALAAQ